MNMQLIESILEAAFDLEDFPAGSPLDPMCESSADAVSKATVIACDLATERDRLRAYCLEIAMVSDAQHQNAKRALLAVFLPILSQLESACIALGVQ
jgi:hypothetical protein